MLTHWQSLHLSKDNLFASIDIRGETAAVTAGDATTI